MGASFLSAIALPALADEGIETVVVTAEKRSESVQDVPLAVTALTGQALANMGAKKFEDFALSAPSVSFTSNGSTQDKVVMRGITSGSFFEAQTASTGFYLDDVPLSSNFTSGGTDLDLYDVNRVEVLRGPQGTLYGAGAMGGAIRIITNQPDPAAFSSSVELTAADTRGALGTDVNGMVNIPLSDDLAFRAVGMYRNQNGYIDDPVQGQKNVNGNSAYGGRMALRWQPNSELDITLTGIYQHDIYDNQTMVDLTPGTKKPVYGDLTQNVYYPQRGTATTAIVNLAINYEMPWATLVSSSTFFRNTTNAVTDDTLSLGVELNTALGLPPVTDPRYRSSLPDAAETYVEEVRLVSTETTPFKWILGAYFQHDNLIVHRVDRFDPASLVGSFGIVPLDYYTQTRRSTYAVFGEGTYDFNKEWHFTSGVRYTYVPTNYYSDVYGAAVGVLDPAMAFAPPPRSKTSTDLSPKFELSFTPNEQMLFYGEVAKGFRPGSPNSELPSALGVPDEMKPDHLWDYELGAKTSWFDNRLIANGAIYYIDWRDIQVVSQTPSFPNIPFLGNVGNATSRGAELELQARPSDRWQFTLSGAYTDSHYATANPQINISKGERIATIPKLSGTAAVDYVHPLTDTITGFVHFDVRYESSRPAGYATTDEGVNMAPYAIGNLRFGVNLPSDVDVTLFVNNLWDDRAQLYMSTSPLCTAIPCASFNPAKSAMYEVLIVQPRTFGITLAKRF
jgi:outer membrane receptor protein involved in Fe transport